MKKINAIYAILGFVLILSIASCKKTESPAPIVTPPYLCATCKNTPDALAANDAVSKGIYKGVVIGSSGTIVFDVLNNGSTITAKLVLDSITANLTTTVTWVAGQPYVAPFTGTYNGSAVSITFSVGVSGSTPTVTASNIPGHPNASFTIVKETSTSQILAFEGTYHTTLPEDGIFNIVVSKGARLWGAAARKNGATSTNYDNGTVTADNKLFNSGGTNVGTITGDVLNGSSLDGGGRTVTIKGRRTL